MRPRHTITLLLQAQRRVFALAMLVLQMAVVLAPLADQPGRRSVTHMEEVFSRVRVATPTHRLMWASLTVADLRRIVPN